MRKVSIAVIVGTLFLLGMSVFAQDQPTKLEVGVDYSLLDFNPSANYTSSQVLNGGGGSVVFYPFSSRTWLGIKTDLQGYSNSQQNFVIPAGNTLVPSGGSFHVSGNMFTYLFGPQIKKRGKIEPYGQVLFGGAHSNAYANLYTNALAVNPLLAAPAPGVAPGTVASVAPDSTAFAFTVGFGVDIHINKRISVRPLEVGYLLTHFNNSFSGGSQNTFRYMAGVTFNLK
jgi:hypothetical protein